MEFAAGAVVEVIAPPARPPERTVDDGAEFDAHLEAASANEESDAAEADAEPLAQDKNSEFCTAGPQPSQQPAMTPVLAQLLAGEAPLTASSEAAQQSAAAAETPLVGGAATPLTAAAAEPHADAAPAAGASASTQPNQGQSVPSTIEPARPPQPSRAEPQAPPDQTANLGATAPAASISDEAATALAALSGQTDAPAASSGTPAAQAQPPSPTRATVEKQTGAPKDAITEAPEIAVNATTRAPRADDKPIGAAKARADYVAAAAQDAPAPKIAVQNPEQSPLTTAALGQNTAPNTHTHYISGMPSPSDSTPATVQVAREIIRHFDGNNTRFELRLDPPELGRVEVKLEVSRDHRVTAVVAADSPQALSELMRHARELEQTLQSAGLELNDNGLSFDLRREPSRGENTNHEHRGADPSSADQAESALSDPVRQRSYEHWRGARLDMIV